MATSLSTTILQPALKEAYADFSDENLFRDFPFLAIMPKRTDAGGKYWDVEVKYQRGQNRSRTFSDAQTNTAPSRRVSFDVTYVNDHGVSLVDDDAVMDAMNKGLFREAGELLKNEADDAIETLMENTARSVFRNLGGAAGRVSSISTDTITLTNPEDSVHFYKDQVLNLASTDGTSGAIRSGDVTVSYVDHDAGTIVCTTHVTGGISAAAANDYLFVEGDFGASCAGLESWIPATAPTAGDSFFGVDRSQAPQQLAGSRYDGSNESIETALIRGVSQLRRISGRSAKPDVIIMNPVNYADLAIALGQHREGSVDSRDTDTIFSFDTIRMAAGGLMIDVLADPYCQVNVAWVLTLNSWEIASVGKLVDVQNADGIELNRVYNADQWEIRVKSRYCVACKDPGANARITLAS